MSARPGRRRFAFVLLTTLALLTPGLAGGCGFRPMYGPEADGGSVLNDFAAIEVDVITDRPGQELRNDLLDRLTPRGRPADPRYRLTVVLKERIDKLAVQRTGVPTRANLIVTANYSLTDLTTGAIALQRSTEIVGSYNLIDSDYSTLVAENYTRSRVVERIAEDIRTRLATHFAAAEAGAARTAPPPP